MKQKTLFACLAAFAAVFAFSACDGFGDDDTPINEYVAGSWVNTGTSLPSRWTLSLTPGGAFNLSGYDLSSSQNDLLFVTLTGDYYGEIDQDDLEGDMDLWGDDGSLLEINYHRGSDKLFVESVYSDNSDLERLLGITFSRN